MRVGLALGVALAVSAVLYSALPTAAGSADSSDGNPLCVVQFWAWLSNTQCSGVRDGAYDMALTNTCTTFPNGGAPTSQMYTADASGTQLTLWQWQTADCSGSQPSSARVATGVCSSVMGTSEYLNLTCPTPPFASPELVQRQQYWSQPCSGSPIGGSTDLLLQQFCYFDGNSNHFTLAIATDADSQQQVVAQHNHAAPATDCSGAPTNTTVYVPLWTCIPDPQSDAAAIFSPAAGPTPPPKLPDLLLA